MSSLVLTANVKSALLRGWRERWPDERWSVAVKRHFPPGSTGDVCQLADVLLEQTLVGPSPSLQLLSYLRHAVVTQMVSCSATIASLVKQTDVSRGHCMSSLLHFTADALIPNTSALEDCVTGNSLLFCKSILSLLVWLLNIILKSIEHQVTSAATDKALGLPTPSIDGAFSYGTLIDQACDGVDKLTSSDTISALLRVAAADDADLSDTLNQLTSEVAAVSAQLSADRRNRVVMSLDSVNRLKSIGEPRGHLLDLSTHTLNISVNTFVGVEAILSPTNDSQLVTRLLELMRNSQGMTRTQLYVELIRSSLMLVVDVVGRSDELKCVAFMFLKLPIMINQLELEMSEPGDSASSGGHSSCVYNALSQLLTYMPLLDLVDTKCNCDCLQYLLHELSSKYSLLTEDQCTEIHNKRSSRSLRPADVGAGQQSSAFLILRAETTVTSILNTLDADYSKNLDAVLGILCQMMSGKSFELILSAAAVTGKLPMFAAEFIKFNEMAKSAGGETGKAAQTRALLFDMTFLMLVHIIQLYGLEVISSSPDMSSSFIVQWGLRCWPEDGKYKCLEPPTPAESNKIDVFLGQLGSSGSELKLNLTRWNEVCQTASFAVQELLHAWQYGIINTDNITIFIDNLRSTLCCLPVVVSSWLCNYVGVSDGETRQKALQVLQLLHSPPSSPPSQTAETLPQFYTERSNIMYTILSKMVSGLTSTATTSCSTDVPSASQNSSHNALVSCFRGILQNGSVDSDAVRRLDSLMTAAGPVCYTDQLVHAVLSYDRPEDLYQAVGVLYSVFHLDIDNLTLSLLNITLPGLLLQSLHVANASLALSCFGSGQVPASSSAKFLNSPRGGALAKLCVLCVSLMCTTRQFASSSDGKIGCRVKRPTRADILLEEPKLEDDDDDDDSDDDDENDEAGGDGKFDDNTFDGPGPTKARRQTFDGPVLPLDAESTFALPGSEFMSTASNSGRPHTSRQRFDAKDLLRRSLVRLFRLMQNILSDTSVSPRTAFVAAFFHEILKLPTVTLRFIRQCMPRNLVSLLARTLPSEFTVDDLICLHDLSIVSGRRSAARVVVQRARYAATSPVDG